MKVLNYLSQTARLILMGACIGAVIILVLAEMQPKHEPVAIADSSCIIEIVKPSRDTWTLNVDLRGAGRIVEELVMGGFYDDVELFQVASNRFEFTEVRVSE